MCSEKYLAIDVGGTAIKYIICDKTLKIYETGEIKTVRDEGELFNLLDEIISPHLDEIDGIALSFPGKINVELGIAHTAGAFRWISDLNLKSMLEEEYGKRVWIENDGKCAALAELWKGNLHGVKNGVFIGLGTEIAGGIILNGKLYRGSDGCSGEFSSIFTSFKNPDNAERLGKIGGHGSLVKNYSGNEDVGDTYEFFQKYHKGDEEAVKVLREYAKTIAVAIINIQSILDAEKFCIGGGISAEDALIDEIRKNVHEFYKLKMPEAFNEPEIEKCRFGNMAGCAGALYNFLVMEKSI